MDLTQLPLDVVRATHLVLFAAGMGAGIYFDFEKLRTLRNPISDADVEILARLHVWITYAFGGLWITGLILVFARTSFVISEFSPKLWLKIALMSFMVWNSWLIGRVVLPTMHANVGRPLTSLSALQFGVVGQVAILSVFLWTSGLLLGSSAVLKTATWDVLLPLTAGWCLLLTVCGQTALHVMRREQSQFLPARQL